MLHDTDAEFAIIDSAHKTESTHKYHFIKKYRDNGTKKYRVPVKVLKKYLVTLVHGTAHLRKFL